MNRRSDFHPQTIYFRNCEQKLNSVKRERERGREIYIERDDASNVDGLFMQRASDDDTYPPMKTLSQWILAQGLPIIICDLKIFRLILNDPFSW